MINNDVSVTCGPFQLYAEIGPESWIIVFPAYPTCQWFAATQIQDD
jgi:hypothetical protein